MHYVIRVVGLESGESSEDDARYLCRLEDPSGALSMLSTTADHRRALRFATPDEAFDLWCSAPLRGFRAAIEPLDRTTSLMG